MNLVSWVICGDVFQALSKHLQGLRSPLHRHKNLTSARISLKTQDNHKVRKKKEKEEETKGFRTFGFVGSSSITFLESFSESLRSTLSLTAARASYNAEFMGLRAMA